MIIDKVHIKKFRGFNDVEFSLGEHVIPKEIIK
jgi:predicted ATP-dependent endonuclease of OLD family